jgi:hypothetical protein
MAYATVAPLLETIHQSVPRNCNSTLSPTALKVMVVPLPKLVGVNTPVSAPAASATYTIALNCPAAPSARVSALPVAVDVNAVVKVVKLTAPAPLKDCTPVETAFANVCVPLNVCAASVLAIVAEVDGKVITVASVPANAMELFAVSVLPSAIVSVAEVAGAVTATLLMLVADATPKFGVTNVAFVNRFVLVIFLVRPP